MSTTPEPDAPPTPVSKFLGDRLNQHSAPLKALGYDEPTDYRNLSAKELDELIAELEKKSVPRGHVNGIRRLMQAAGAGKPTAETPTAVCTCSRGGEVRPPRV